MKKILMAVVAAAAVAMGGVAMGATQTVTVNATVVGTCQFNSGGSISFPSLDAVSGGTATVIQPQFWCTKNSTYNITDDKGLYDGGGPTPRMQSTTAPYEYIPYTFIYTATGSGTGKTAPINMDIISAVNIADLENIKVGDYSDTVTLTITP
jgi:spore coat protein U-like protein